MLLRGDPGYLTSELKRRKVPRAALAYFFTALAVLEAADLIFPSLFLPEVAYRGVLAVVLMGFPVTIIVAWMYEFGPDGIRRERDAEPGARPAGRIWRRTLIPSLFFAVVIMIWRPWRATDAIAGLATDGFADSAAVLPIEDQTDGEGARYAAALTDEMVRRLQLNDRIKVIDPNSVANLVELGITDRQLADSLGVDKLIRGTLYAEEDRLLLNVRTTDGETANVLWAGQYEAPMTDGWYQAVSSMASAFGSEYEGQTPALSPQAYAAPMVAGPGLTPILEGQRSLARRTFEGINEARRLFESAADSAPGDASAFAHLATAHALTLAYRYRGGAEGYAAAGLSLAFANRAIELDPELPNGYAARALLGSRSQAPLRSVGRDCERALDLSPNGADGLSWCGRVWKELGWNRRALDAASQAVTVDPRNAGRRVALAYDAMSVRQYDRAIEEARAARALSPQLALPRVLEARALLLAGRPQECLSLDLGPHQAMRATCLYEVGRVEEAQAIVDSVTAAVSAAEPDTHFTDLIRAEDLAVYYAWTGDADLALSWVRLAYELSPWVEARILESDLFEPVRSAPDFSRNIEAMQDSVWERVERAAEDARRSHRLLGGA